MLMMPTCDPTTIVPADLAAIRSLYDAGLCLRAYDRARAFGPLASWTGTRARILAGSLAAHLGSPRLGRSLHVRAWRNDPTDPEACLYHSFTLLSGRGPLPTWEFLREVGTLPDAPAPGRGATGCRCMRPSSAISATSTPPSGGCHAPRMPPPDAPGCWSSAPASSRWRTAATRRSPRRGRPSSSAPGTGRPSSRRPTCSNCSTATTRPSSLLSEAAERIESSALAAQLGVLQAEMDRHAEARQTWDRFAEKFPLIDDRTRKWLAGQRSDAAYACGDLSQAAALARQSGERFFAVLAPASRHPRPTRAASGSTSVSSGSITRPAPGDPGLAVAVLGTARRPPRARRRDLLRRNPRPPPAVVGRAQRVPGPRVHRDVGCNSRAAGSRGAVHSRHGRDAERASPGGHRLRHAAGHAPHPRPHPPLLGRGPGRGDAGAVSLERPARDGDGAGRAPRPARWPGPARGTAVRPRASDADRAAGARPRGRRAPPARASRPRLPAIAWRCTRGACWRTTTPTPPRCWPASRRSSHCSPTT